MESGPSESWTLVKQEAQMALIEGTEAAETLYATSGDDIINAYGGDDIIYFGPSQLNDADRVDGGGGYDQLVLQGEYPIYSVTLGANISGIESLQLLRGNDTRFGAPGSNYEYNPPATYNITTLDSFVNAGRTLFVDASALRSSTPYYIEIGKIWQVQDDGPENLTFDGSAETDGHFYILSGAGNDRLIGGAGNDLLSGGAGTDYMAGGPGNDTYIVDSLADVVVEADGGGIDTVETSVGSRTDFNQLYVLPDFVENLLGVATGAQGVRGNSLDNVITMGNGNDLIVLHDGGDDTARGGEGNDFFFYGSTLTAPDSNDGGSGYDTVGLQGTYSAAYVVALGTNSLVNIEKLALYTSGNEYFPNHYDVTTVDANVAVGAGLMVVAQSLLATETLKFNGSAETNGSFNVRGGRGNDTITTGAGNDQLWGNLGADRLSGGAGNDSFEYYAAAESTAASRD